MSVQESEEIMNNQSKFEAPGLNGCIVEECLCGRLLTMQARYEGATKCSRCHRLEREEKIE